MDAKRYLSKYQKMKRRIKRLQDLHDEYIRLSFNIPGFSFDQIRVSGTRNLESPHAKWIHKAMEVDYDIEVLTKKLPLVKAEVLNTICEIDDPDLERLLIYRYIDWLTWGEIADKMHYSTATIRRWHEKAIALIKVPEILSSDEQP